MKACRLRLPLPLPAYSRRAFTLIELLVVIVILGILMAVAVPTFLKQQSKAQDSRTQQYLTTAFKAIRASTPDTGNQYPSSTSMVSWIKQSEPELVAQRGSCSTAVQSAPQDAVLVDTASTANALTLCARSQSGNVWKLIASAAGTQQLLDGTLLPFTFSGNEITDATRATRTQGDGLTNDSSTGVWEATTNVVPNGGFETDFSGWTSISGATLTRDTSKAMFGAASLKVASPSAGDGAHLQNIFGVSSSAIYTISAWVWVPTGLTVQVTFQDSTNAVVAQTNIAGNSGWQRVTASGTTSAGISYIYAGYKTFGAAGTFWVDGVQIEQKAIATPYVETNGASASRAAARVQAPASVLDPTQGWVAFRLRMGFPSTDLPDHWILDDGGSTAGRVFLRWIGNGGATGSFWMGRQIAGSGGGATASPTFAAGGVVTVIGSWIATQAGVSVNGAAFSTSGNTMIPTLTNSLLDIGRPGNTATLYLDSDVLWFACGTGTLSNADAATINSWGSTDPKVSSFPATAQTTMVWNGSSSSGSLK